MRLIARAALHGRPRSGRRPAVLAAAIGAVATAVVVVAGVLVRADRGGLTVTPPPPSRLAPVQAATTDVTTVATVHVTSARYASPGQQEPGVVPASWYGRPSVLPVLATSPGWVRVRLAQRPDGTTAWLPAADVTLSTTPYQIVINLPDKRLMLYKDGRQVLSAPAGIGAPGDPTPSGNYFVAFFEPPPQPNLGYGPFILVTSDHSRSIQDWEGSGDAVIGIHGPLGESAEIGTTGARISHGCIRLHLAALRQLRDVLPGTPIRITA